MLTNGLFLETERYPDGVDLERGNVEVTDLQHGTTFGEFREYFRARSARRQPIRLEFQNLNNPVVVEFVNAREDSQLAQFFSKFGWDSSQDPSYSGWLSSGARDHGPQLQFVRTSQKEFRNWLGSLGGSGALDALQAITSSYGYAGVQLEPEFNISGEDGIPRMLLKCSSLTNFMKMEVAMAAMHGAKLATCEHCRTVFLTGPLTGRRSHAKYCSDRCRVAAMRARNRGELNVNS
jgi:hypothetical protein